MILRSSRALSHDFARVTPSSRARRSITDRVFCYWSRPGQRTGRRLTGPMGQATSGRRPSPAPDGRAPPAAAPRHPPTARPGGQRRPPSARAPSPGGARRVPHAACRAASGADGEAGSDTRRKEDRDEPAVRCGPSPVIDDPAQGEALASGATVAALALSLTVGGSVGMSASAAGAGTRTRRA